ncbi:MAG TPA: DUF4383 domain-containing protein [Candidatus Thermoplasmatota archaeon]|nr:DUF4383 domain-containing protein [Candidatus Thermoplasmatota archaeon]
MARNVTVERNVGTNRYNNVGPARTYALVFGITYLVVAAVEAYLGYMDQSLIFGGATILSFALVHNIVHWATGLALLGGGLAKEWNAKGVVRTIGIVFAVVALLGIFARDFMGMLLGHDGPLPWSYNWIHIGTSVLALVAGFVNFAPENRTRTSGV